MSEVQPNSFSHNVGRSVLKGAIAIAGLFIVRLIVMRLPMVSDAVPVLVGSPFTPLEILVPPADIARTVIDTLIFAAIVATARDVQKRIHASNIILPAAGPIVLLVAIIIVLVLAYSSYTPVVSAIIGDQEAYNWLFLVLGVLAVGALVLTVYRNLDAITEIVFHSGAKILNRANSAVSPAPVVALAANCGNCGTKIPNGARFCGNCGHAVPAP